MSSQLRLLHGTKPKTLTEQTNKQADEHNFRYSRIIRDEVRTVPAGYGGKDLLKRYIFSFSGHKTQTYAPPGQFSLPFTRVGHSPLPPPPFIHS